MAIDATDAKILRLLQQNAKIKMKDIAQQLGMTITPIYERIKKMERNGIITNYTIQVDEKYLGYHLTAYCSVTLKEHSKEGLKLFEEKVIHIDQVLECNHLSGNFDYLLKVVVKDMADYQSFISNQLAGLDNIGQVQSYFVMKSVKNSRFSVA